VSLRLILALYAAVVGLITGSYLNVVIHRLPRQLSTVLPRSRCPSCGSLIRPYDNIPLLSYLILRGRCRVCKAPISARYPFIEVLTAGLFVAAVERFGPTRSAFVAAGLSALLLALATIDLEHMILPDRLTYPGIVVGIAIQPWIQWVGVKGALVGAALGAGILLVAYGGWWLVRREEGLGLGDVKMLALVGAFLGWRGVVVALFLGALAGAAVGLALMIARRGDVKSRLPFGTFLAAGALVALYFGPGLVSGYLTMAFGASSPP
jgi:leader peptidase (prepilin peptidase)/N-methyltransferase